MTTKFNMTRDINGYNAFGAPFTDTKFDTILSIGVAQYCTAPSDAEYFLAIFGFESGATVYVANNFTATIPAASFAATNSEMNPTARSVQAGDVLSFITSNETAEVWVGFYAL